MQWLQVRKLTPVAFALTVIDTVEDKIEEVISYSGKDVMKIFFETLDNLYPILAEKHSLRMQKFRKIKSKEGNTKKVIEECRKNNTKCWVCNSHVRYRNRLVDHCHTTGNYL